MHDHAYSTPASRGEAFKVYPRGFLGAKLHDRVQNETKVTETNRGFIPVKISAYKKSNGINDYNHGIEALFSAYVREEAGVLSFDFRERVLKAALEAFGTTWFDTWFLAQLQSPFVGRMQRDFLDDTLRYLQGHRRNLCMENWAALLTIDNVDDGGLPASKTAIEFFGLNAMGKSRKVTLEDTLQQWCSQPGGHEDLLGTLHILFGAV